MSYLRTIQAHFDGKSFVPDEKVDLPVGIASKVTVELAGLPTPHPVLPPEEIARRRGALRELHEKLATVTPVPLEAVRRVNLYGDDGKLN